MCLYAAIGGELPTRRSFQWRRSIVTSSRKLDTFGFSVNITRSVVYSLLSNTDRNVVYVDSSPLIDRS